MTTKSGLRRFISSTALSNMGQFPSPPPVLSPKIANVNLVLLAGRERLSQGIFSVSVITG